MLAAPISGVIADRFDRRRVLIIDHVFLMALALGFSAVVLADVLAVWHMYAFSFLTGVAWSINNPIRQALVGNSVPRESLMNAIALNSMAFNSMRMIGPAIGGGLIVLVGPGVNFLLQGSLYVCVFFALYPFRPEYGMSARSRTQSWLRDLADGFRYVKSSRIAMTTMLLSFIPMFTLMSFISTQMPVYAALVIGDEEGGALAFLFTAMGVGGFVGTIIIARFSRIQQKGVLVIVSVALAAVMLIILSQIESLYWAGFVVAVQQLFFIAVMTTNNTILQLTTPDEMRGRVMGIFMLDVGLVLFGGFIAGLLASAFSVSFAWLAGGVTGLVALLIVAIFAKSFRNLRL
jgi:MFS family permease